MIRLTRLHVVAGLSLMGFLVSGCSNKIGLELRDAAISAASAFVEQQTLELLLGTFGSETAP